MIGKEYYLIFWFSGHSKIAFFIQTISILTGKSKFHTSGVFKPDIKIAEIKPQFNVFVGF